MAPTYLKKLNKQQRRAVKHGVKDGRAKPAQPLLILAGAGTGKTLTLATRVAHLLSGADPRSMMISSYTRKASKQLVERVQRIHREATGRKVDLPYAGTFHSVALALLTEFARDLGIRSKFRVIDPKEAEDLVEMIRTRDGHLGKKKYSPTNKQCVEVHSYKVNACLTLANVLEKKFPHLKKWQRELRKLFTTFRVEKRSQGLMDYDDLLVQLGEAIKHPKVGPVLRRRFKYVLIDEYQDTNRLQFKIIRRLKPDGIGVTVVGDDAQAIYSFRATTVENILQFEASFTTPAKVITLEENYRSTQPILAASNAVINQSKKAFRKALFSKRRSKRLPRLVTVNDEFAQADCVVQTVLRACKRGIPLSKQAVLFRTDQQCRAVEVALEAAHIPTQKWGGIKFLDAANVRDVLAMLRWWENPRDRLSAFRVLKLLDGLGDKTALSVLEEVEPGRLVQSLTSAKPDRATKKQWARLVRLLSESREREWPFDLEAVVAWYRPILERKFEDEIADRADGLKQLIEIAGTFSSRGEFLKEIALEPPDGFAKPGQGKPSHDDVLTLSTIHSAKGHEWSKVILISAVDGCLPSSRATGAEDLDEERRLFYVAMTRPKTELDVIAPSRVFQTSEKFPSGNLFPQPSRFITPSIRKLFKREIG